MRKIQVPTSRVEDWVDITALVQGGIAQESLREGAVMVYSPHTSAGVCPQEGVDPAVASDLSARLQELAPKLRPEDRHAEGNSDAHLKTLLTGQSVLVPISGGKLLLGRWQRIFLVEFDGPRMRELWLTLLS